MSRNSRRRREEKQRRRAQQEARRSQRTTNHRSQPCIDDVLWAAAATFVRGWHDDGDRLVRAAQADPAAPAAAARLVRQAVTGALDAGWSVELLAHITKRRVTAAAARLVSGAERLTVAPVGDAVRVAAALMVLPTVDPLRRPVDVTGVDDKALARVRALLAKAESTSFPEEAEALTAKAQELMARHSLHAALVGGDDDELGGLRVPIDDPYASAKSLLLQVIAEANRCRAVFSADVSISTVLGFPGDLRATELLFTSLLVQATNAMLLAGTARSQRQRGFRSSFLVAFASRIGERLRDTSARQTSEFDDEVGGSLLPVLVARRDRVDDAIGAMFPGMVRKGGSVSDWAGYQAGRAAADAADLSRGGHLEAG